MEEWFYLIFPLFLLVCIKFLKFNNQKFIIYASIVFIIIIFLLRFINIEDEEWGSSVRRIVIYRLDSIVFGFVLYFYKDKISDKFFNKISLLIGIILTSIILYKILEINALKT